MTLNRQGVTRLVFIFDKFVVKIPNFTCQWNHFLKGIIANIEESKTWQYNSGKYERGLSYLLCPVLWCSWGGWVLVMKRAQMLTIKDWGTVTVPEHKKHFPGDDTLSNYGWLNGKVVKVDYGDLDIWGSDFKNMTV